MRVCLRLRACVCVCEEMETKTDIIKDVDSPASAFHVGSPAGVVHPGISMSPSLHPQGERPATSLGHSPHTPSVLADRVQLLLQQDNSSELTHGEGGEGGGWVGRGVRVPFERVVTSTATDFIAEDK